MSTRTKQRFFDFRFRRNGQIIDRFGEIDFQGDTTLHIHPDRSGRGWIVREGPAQAKRTTPILEISSDARHVRPVGGRTIVLWTKQHGASSDTESHTGGDWIPANETDYVLVQILESDLQILVDTNPVVQDLHPEDRDRYTNTRNLGFRSVEPSTLLSTRFQVDP